MRAILFVFILAIVALLIAFGSGFMSLTPTRSAEAPRISVDRSGVEASGGQTPAFDIETGTVAVGTTSRNVKVPRVNVTPPAQEASNVAGTPVEPAQ